MTIELLICWLLFTWIVLVVLQSFVHFHLIEVLKSKPNYIVWGLIRGIVSIVHAGLGFDTQRMLDYWPVLAFHILTHIAIFAPLLNKLRAPMHNLYSIRINFWYLGEQSGWFDTFWKGHHKLYKAFYFTACGLIPVSIWWIFRAFTG